ncbi:MAG: phytoene desaturase family protein [Acidimicrobiales bacterium]
MEERFDAVVIGSGPNGLAAALVLVRSGWKVLVLERARQIGGGARTEELTLPGFRHDVCSAIHPLALASPAMRDLDLESVGVRWIQPDAPLGHALRPDRAVMMERGVAETAAGLGEDGRAWQRLFGPSVAAGHGLTDSLLDPISIPRHPISLARFGLTGIRSATSLGRRFVGDDAPALLAGMSAHSMLALDAPITGGLGMLLGMLGQSVGWPIPEGGSQAIVDGLVKLIEAEGGEIRTDTDIASLDDLPPSRAVLCDVAPKHLLTIAGDRLPGWYRKLLGRFRYGPGVFKLDWALDGPVPWADPALARAGTVHLGGTIAEIRASEAEVIAGRHPDQPFMLLAQQSLFDPTRAPIGKHTLWGYCHVPSGSTVDMTEAMEARIEQFAPGFRDLILARAAANAREVEDHNPNYVAGDINAGIIDLRQFVFRPVPSLSPWTTPADGLYLCSSSTPPGGGVHGMCGLKAAQAALRRQPVN